MTKSWQFQMSFFLSVIVVFALLPGEIFAFQQADKMTAEKVLERFVEVSGGSEARGKVNARSSSGDVSYEFGGQTMQATFLTLQKAPNFSRIEIEVPSLGTIVNGFDGKKGWSVGGQMGDEVFDEKRNKTAAAIANFHGLAQWQQTYESVSLVGTDKVEESPAYRVECITETGTQFVHFFDKKTGLLVQSINPVNSPQIPVDVLEVMHGDYREVDGIQYPFLVKHIARDVGGNGDLIQTYRYKRIEHVDEIDGEKFAIPQALRGGQTQTDHSSGESDKSNYVSTVADGIEAGTGGLCIDQKGNIYTSDFGSQLGGAGKGGQNVFQVDPKGNVKQFCGEQNGASGSMFDGDGRLFQANIRANLINVVSQDGKVEEFCRKGLVNPVGLTLDDDGNIYVCNCGSGSIQKITPDGLSTKLAQDTLLRCPNGITMADDGNLYVSNFMNGDVLKVTLDGKVSRLATLPGNNNGHLVFHHGALFVVARGAHQIYRVTLEGEAALIAGNGKRKHQDGSAEDASFSLPNGICVGPDGNSLLINEVADVNGNQMNLMPTRIRKIELKQ